MKRFVLPVLLSMLFVPSLHADIQKITESGTIKVGLYRKDSFPFFFKGKDGRLAGCDIDVAKDIAENLGVKPVFLRQAKTFDQLTELLVDKKVDMVVSWFSRTLERAKKIKFTSPYFIDRQVLLLNRMKVANFSKSNILRDLKNRKTPVGTVKGTSYVQFLGSVLPPCKVVLYNTWKDCMKDVVGGKITAGLWTGIEIFKVLHDEPDLSIKVKAYPLVNKDFICIGVNPHDSQLLYWLNLFLKEKNYNFTHEGLFQKYKEAFSSSENRKQ